MLIFQAVWKFLQNDCKTLKDLKNCFLFYFVLIFGIPSLGKKFAFIWTLWIIRLSFDLLLILNKSIQKFVFSKIKKKQKETQFQILLSLFILLFVLFFSSLIYFCFWWFKQNKQNSISDQNKQNKQNKSDLQFPRKEGKGSKNKKKRGKEEVWARWTGQQYLRFVSIMIITISSILIFLIFRLILDWFNLWKQKKIIKNRGQEFGFRTRTVFGFLQPFSLLQVIYA